MWLYCNTLWSYSAIKTCKCCRAFFLLCVWPGSAISQFWCKHFTNLIYPHYFTKPAFVSCLTFNRHFIFKSTIHPSVCHKLFRAISQKLFKFYNMKLHRCLYINEEKGGSIQRICSLLRNYKYETGETSVVTLVRLKIHTSALDRQ